MSDIIEILRQYRSEWENVCPDAVMKKNLRDRMFALLGRRTPTPSPLEAAREALILAERWFDSSRVSHHRECAGASPIMPCNCGVRATMGKITAALSALSGPAKGGAKI